MVTHLLRYPDGSERMVTMSKWLWHCLDVMKEGGFDPDFALRSGTELATEAPVQGYERDVIENTKYMIASLAAVVIGEEKDCANDVSGWGQLTYITKTFLYPDGQHRLVKLTEKQLRSVERAEQSDISLFQVLATALRFANEEPTGAGFEADVISMTVQLVDNLDEYRIALDAWREQEGRA